MLVTCAYLVDRSSPWVLQSLFLAAIGESKDKGAAGLEAFAYVYPEPETAYERFFVHRTIFPSDFLADFGFRTVRAGGSVELARLELGGLVPVVEGPAEAGDPGRERGVPAGAAHAAAAVAASASAVLSDRASMAQDPPMFGRRPERELERDDVNLILTGAHAYRG